MRISRTLALGASLLVLLGACTAGGGSTPTATSAATAAATAGESAAATVGSSAASAAPSGGSASAAPSAGSAAASAAPAGSASASDPTIKIGSDGFYEAKLMAEIYAQALEAYGYKVDRTGIGMGARKVSAPALESGQIDLKPEYIGSGLAFYEPGKQTGDPNANEQALASVLANKGGGITVLNFSPAADQNAFVVRKDTADQFHLSKMSDLAAVASQLKFGVATDCATNPVCGAALKSAYGLDVSNATKLSACDTPMVQALKGKTIDVGELCSTQPDIAVNNWVVLADDKETQPADNIAPLVRNDILAKLADKAGFEAILNNVSAAMDTATLTDLGKQVSVDKKDIAVVAKAWLLSKGLTK
jgi:osmoprotectant transport system substrate-binding protein